MDLAGYRLYWRLDNAAYMVTNSAPIQGRTNTTITLTNLTALGGYSLVVTAVSSNGWESLYSNEITVTNVPTAPTGLKVTLSVEHSDSPVGPWLPQQEITFNASAPAQAEFWRTIMAIHYAQ